MVFDYTGVTELPGNLATREQQARLYHRYHTASLFAEGKYVLEVACGAGMGLGYLVHKVDSLVGGDYTENLLNIAYSHYKKRIPLVRLDAHYLPFRSRTFDLILLFEAIYYLKEPESFISESHRVLSDDGILMIGTVNKDWSEFIPSALSTKYFSVPELRDLLANNGFKNLKFFAAFPTTPDSFKKRIISLFRRLAVALNLVPKTLGGREHLKRMFYGDLTPINPEVQDGMAELYPLVPISSEAPNYDYKILYVVAHAL